MGLQKSRKIQIENAIRYLDHPINHEAIGWKCKNMEEVLDKFAWAYGLELVKEHDLILCEATYIFIIDDPTRKFDTIVFHIPIAEITNVADTLRYIIKTVISEFELTDE